MVKWRVVLRRSQERGALGGVAHGREVLAVHVPVAEGLRRGGREAVVPVVDVADHEQSQLQDLRAEGTRL